MRIVGKVKLKNAYQQQEFIASTDMNFRPVNTTTGLTDACILLTCTGELSRKVPGHKDGSFLRPKNFAKGFDKNLGVDVSIV
jgi:hypothetical protein